MRVGIDTLPLSPPYTGVGNYLLSLLDALLGEDGAGPSIRCERLEFRGFGARSWHAVDAAYVRERIAAGALPLSAKGRDQAVSPSALRRTAAALSSMPLAHRLAGQIRARVFEAGLNAQRLDLFHAFIHRAPSLAPPVPVIPVIHDLAYIRHPETVPDSRRRWLEPVAAQCRRAPVIHAVSAFTAGEIAALFGVARDRIHVIRPAVRDVFLQEADGAGRDADDAALVRHDVRARSYALAVASLEPRKNLRTLLAAYEGLGAAQRQRMPLLLVGSAHQRPWGDEQDHVRLDRLVREGSVRRLGHVDDRLLATLYRHARLMVFPSLYEGFGMPIIEALACGAPVVTSDAASMPEAAQGAARLVAPLDVDAWRAALREALDDDAALSPAAVEARRSKALSWRWVDAARSTLGLYEAALAQLQTASGSDRGRLAELVKDLELR